MAYAMTAYEWISESTDEHGDIEDVQHCDSKESAIELGGRVCLVRDSGPRLETRMWAYLKDGTLPETFSDSSGEDTGVKIPKRFR